MVKTLQRKFVTASMLAVTLLLLTLVGAINVLNTLSVTRRQAGILELLCETDGHPEKRFQAGMNRKKPEDRREDGLGPETEDSDRSGAFPGESDPEKKRFRQIEERGFLDRGLTADDALSARYFLACFDGEGNLTGTDVSRIFAVDEESAEELARVILAGGRKSGTLEGFRYLVRYSADSPEEAGAAGSGEAPSGSLPEAASANAGTGGGLLIAMDITADRSGLLTVLGISVLIAAVCWAAMLWPVCRLARRAIAPTATSIERQKQFVTNAGHELKTPLAIIQANTDALELYNGPSKWTRNIRAQTVRLNGLMQNLLTLSRMDESGLQLDMKTFRLDLLAREVWSDFAASAEGRNLRFLFAEESGDGEEGLSVTGNRESIAQLLSILYDNAVKYTPRGGEIRICLRKVPGGAELEQSNTISLPEEEARVLREDPGRLFERFYRTDSDRSRKKGGAGIGLSAAKAIAEANHGTIRAACGENRLSMILQLPYRPC